jgi:hypothetical protein
VNPDFNRLLTEPAGDRLDVFLGTERRLGTKFDDRLPVSPSLPVNLIWPVRPSNVRKNSLLDKSGRHQ